MFVNVLCTIKHFRMRKASRSVIILYCNAEAAGFEPANRLRAVNCFRGSLLQPLGHASCYFIGTLSQTLTLRAAFASSTYLLSQIPGPGRSSDDDLFTSPFKRGDQGLRAFHRRNGFPCPPASARHLRMPANPSGVRAKELRGFLLPYTPGVQAAQRVNCRLPTI